MGKGVWDAKVGSRDYGGESVAQSGPDFLRLANDLSARYPKDDTKNGFWMPCGWPHQGHNKV
jgi:hypothetical protein